MRRLLAAAGVAALLVGSLAVSRDAAGDVPVTGPEPMGVAPTGTSGPDGLTPAVARAVDLAIAAAAAEGVDLRITSGWRSADRQAELYAEAVAKYGSPDAARQWVLPPDESAHVTGEAVDVGGPEAAAWLDERGVEWGLCRRYDNEPWHFERLAGALGSECPPREPHP